MEVFSRPIDSLSTITGPSSSESGVLDKSHLGRRRTLSGCPARRQAVDDRNRRYDSGRRPHWRCLIIIIIIIIIFNNNNSLTDDDGQLVRNRPLRQACVGLHRQPWPTADSGTWCNRIGARGNVPPTRAPGSAVLHDAENARAAAGGSSEISDRVGVEHRFTESGHRNLRTLRITARTLYLRRVGSNARHRASPSGEAHVRAAVDPPAAYQHPSKLSRALELIDCARGRRSSGFASANSAAVADQIDLQTCHWFGSTPTAGESGMRRHDRPRVLLSSTK